MTGIYRKKPVTSKERERKHIPHLRFLFQSNKPHFHHGWPCTLIYLHMSRISCSARSSFLKRNEYYSRAYLCLLSTADQNGLGKNEEVVWWNLFTMMPKQGRKEASGWISIDYLLGIKTDSAPGLLSRALLIRGTNEGKRRQERRKLF